MIDPLNADLNFYLNDWTLDHGKKHNVSDLRLNEIHKKLSVKLANEYAISFSDLYKELQSDLNESDKQQLLKNLIWLEIANHNGYLTYKNNKNVKHIKFHLTHLEHYQQFNQQTTSNLTDLEKLYEEVKKNPKSLASSYPTTSNTLEKELSRFDINTMVPEMSVLHHSLVDIINLLVNKHELQPLATQLLTLWLVLELSKKGYSFNFLLNWYKPIFKFDPIKEENNFAKQLEQYRISEHNVLNYPLNNGQDLLVQSKYSQTNYVMKWNLDQQFWDLHEAYNFEHKLKVGDSIRFLSEEALLHNIVFNNKCWIPTDRKCEARSYLDQTIKFDHAGIYYISCEQNQEVMRLIVVVKGRKRCRKHKRVHCDIKVIESSLAPNQETEYMQCNCQCQTNNGQQVNENFATQVMCSFGPSGLECDFEFSPTGVPTSVPTSFLVPTSVPTGAPTGAPTALDLIRLAEVELDLLSILPPLPAGIQYTSDFLNRVRVWIQFDVVLKSILVHQLHITTLPSYHLILNQITSGTVNKVRYYYNLADLVAIENKNDEALDLLKREIGDLLLSRAMARLSCTHGDNPDIEFRALGLWYQSDRQYALFSLSKSLNNDGSINGSELQRFIVNQLNTNNKLKDTLSSKVSELKTYYSYTSENYHHKV